MPRRCALGCPPTGASLHRFPHPIRCPDTLKAWVELVGGKLESPEDYNLYWNKQVICDIHFTDQDKNRNNRLSAIAVPSLHLPGTTPHRSEPKKDPEPLEGSKVEETHPKKGYSNHFIEDHRHPSRRLLNLALPTLRLPLRFPDQLESTPSTSKPTDSEVDFVISNENESESDYEEERLDEDFIATVVKACIGCLSTDGELTDLSEDLRTALHNATGLQVDEDGPSSVCWQCAALIRKCAYFRTQCARAQQALQDAVQDTDQCWQMAISIVDRDKLNLKSRLSICNSNPEITIVYDGDDPEVDVDVKPDTDVDMTEEPIGSSSNDIDAIPADDIPVDDIPVDDTPVDDIPADIDLNDIFKGIKEETASELESICDATSLFEVKVEPEVKKETKQRRYGRKKQIGYKDREPLYFIRKASKALAQAEIKYLSPQEQKVMHHKALDQAFARGPMFKCAVCIKVFRSKEELIAHVKYHTARMSYKYICDICKNRFRTELQYNKHSMYCHWYQYTHTHCTETHYNLHALVACFEKHHKKSDLDEEPLTQLTEHFDVQLLTPEQRYESVPTSEGQYVCSPCNTQFDTQAQLAAHRDTHRPQATKPYQCDICKVYRSNTKALANHMTTCHTFMFKCKYCDNTYNYNMDAKRHLQDSHEFAWSNYCLHTNINSSQCDDTFTSPMSLNVHCSSCGHRATSVESLYQHQLKEHCYIRLSSAAELNDPRYYCIECRVYFANIDAYYGHLARLHQAEANTYANGCIRCAKLFSNPEELNAHNDECHVRKRPSKKLKQVLECLECLGRKPPHCERHPLSDGALCHLCGKTVTQQGMTFHMKVHSHDKFKCPFCRFSSSIVNVIVAHTLVSHTHRPYMCAVCPQRFTHRYSCREHILKVHAPVLPYSCEVCGRKFAHLDLLNDHCRKIHCVDLKKIDRSVFLPKRMLGKIYLYPHMKIDATHVPQTLLQKLQLYLCDYMDENEKIVDHTEYLYFDPDIDPKIPTRNPPTRDRERRKLKQKAKYLKKRRLKELEKQKASGFITDQLVVKIENLDCESSSPNIENCEEVISAVEELQRSEVKSSDCDVFIDDSKVENVTGELVMHNGQQYVLVGNMMYQFES